MKTLFKKRKEHDQVKESSSGQVRYQCPMKCEGDKVYDQPGKCPVCKMNLVKIE